jgi:DNA-directed RNA polymerase subunit RPC12/RpoP
MANDRRTWTCRNCGRSNTTDIHVDGTVECAYCFRRMSIQPSRSRAAENARPLSHLPRVKGQSPQTGA